MSWFQDLRITSKVNGGFLAVALIAGGIGAIGIAGIHTIGKRDARLYENMAVPLSDLSTMSTQFQRVRVNLQNIVLSDSPKERQDFADRAAGFTADIDKASAAFEKRIISPEMRAAFAKYVETREAFAPIRDRVLELGLAGKREEARRILLSEGLTAARDELAAIDTMTKMKVADGGRLAAENRRAETAAIVTMLALAAIGLGVAVGLGRYIASLIGRPLARLSDAAHQAALGDVNVAVVVDGKDEVADVSRSFQVLVDSVRGHAEAARRIARGDLSADVAILSDKDDLGQSMQAVTVSLRALVTQANALCNAAVEGRLSERADLAGFDGSYRDIVQGVNDTMDAVVEPIHEARRVLGRIALNDFTQEMSGAFRGDFHELADGMTAVKTRLLSVQDAFERVEAGDFSRLEEFRKIGKRSEQDRLMPTVTGMMQTLVNIIQEIETLAEAAAEGRLDVRGDEGSYQGEYREIIRRINHMLASIDEPFSASHAVLARIAVNDFTRRVDGDYSGIFKDCADGINAVRDRMLAVQDVARRVSVGDTSQLEVFRKIGRRSEQDELLPAFTEMMSTIQDLVGETQRLCEMAVAGELKERGDVSRFHGGYQAVVDGINRTLDAVINPINEAAAVLDRVADRDLTARVVGDYQGDHARIKLALNAAVDNVADSLKQVAIGADQVANAAMEISSGSQSLSQGASEQAASLEEITSNLQEMASMTRQNSLNAKEANGLAESARRVAHQGVEGMENLTLAIDRIKASSDQTAKIVKTIDEIAFQTNLLALNAAVEAARAGDAGKGFAVVAEEVRNLAMRSAEAAKNTASMIEEAVKNAEGGVAINHEVLARLHEIDQQVNRVTEVMAEIAAASEQQTQGIDQVASAVREMDTLTQANAANSEQSASSSEELSSQAEEMQSMVANFTLEAGKGASSWTRKAPARSAVAPRPRRSAPPEFDRAELSLAEF